ncbi:hypothetical protein, partial [Bacillus sp. TH13]|uniref:hypothetical protein n=1 Tax=Bacillus sp. TH13 TaxID=2796379 RepID=UPI001A92C312
MALCGPFISPYYRIVGVGPAVLFIFVIRYVVYSRAAVLRIIIGFTASHPGTRTFTRIITRARRGLALPGHTPGRCNPTGLFWFDGGSLVIYGRWT